MNFFKYVFSIVSFVVPFSIHADDSVFKLSDSSVSYEMRIGAIDLRCTDFDYNDSYDQEEKVLQAEVEFMEAGSLSKDPENYKLIAVTTKSKWTGLINTEDGKLSFENKRLVDLTRGGVEKHGSLNSVHITTRVDGEHVRGTIHGTVSLTYHIFSWLSKVEKCTGSSTLIMLPK